MYKILFVSTTGRLKRPYFDPSVRYRCFNIAEELSKKGHYVKVATSDSFINEDLSNFDIYVFHRPPYGAKFIKKIDELNKSGKKLVADFDDLTFDVENALNSSAYVSGMVSEAEALNIFSRNAAALSVFTNFTVSTVSLAKRLLELSPKANVEVVHNSLTEKFKSICQQIHNNEKLERVSGRVGYFSGTKSHDKDIEYISDALINVIGESSSRELFFVGPVSVPSAVKECCSVVRNSLVGYHEMIKLLFTCEVVIAPLEATFFNNCKSSLKYFESAYAGCNVVASPVSDYLRFESKNLYLASNISEWEQSLERALVEYKEQSMQERISDAEQQASIHTALSVWEEFVFNL